MSSRQHATLQRRCRFFHSHPPCCLQAAQTPLQGADDCTGLQLQGSLCVSAAVLVLSGHHSAGHCSRALGCPPYPSTCCFSKTYQVLEKVAAFKPATLHFNVRSQETEWDFRGVCLSSCCTIFCENVLDSPVRVHIQPHSLLGCEGTVGLSQYKVTLPDGD